MRRSTIFLITAVLTLTTPLMWAVDQLAGTWLLKHQEVGSNQTASNPLTLAITPSGNRLNFEFIVTVNNEQFVNLKFSSLLDGTATEISGGDGKPIGTARVSRDGAAYKVLIEGPGRPPVATQMTISSDGMTLVSESDVQTPTGTVLHTKQVFARQ